MKVLLISENPPSIYGGIERHCRNIQLLFQNTPTIEILSLSKKDIKYKKIKFIDKILFSFKELKQAIYQSNCDVVHIHGFASFAVWQAIIVAAQLHKRIIYTAHFHPFNKLDNPILGMLFFYILLKPTLNKIKTIITINKEDTSFFKNYHNNVIMIPNWLSDDKNEKDTNISKKNNMILFVGRNDKNKSPDYLLNIPSKYEIHCVTNSTKGLRNDFIFYHNISDKELNTLYKTASLLVIPSRYEAFSYAALESLMHNTPILISNNVRIADYLNDISGITIFQYGNKQDFLKKIETAITQKVDIEKIKCIFSKNKIKQQLYNIYESN